MEEKLNNHSKGEKNSETGIVTIAKKEMIHYLHRQIDTMRNLTTKIGFEPFSLTGSTTIFLFSYPPSLPSENSIQFTSTIPFSSN